MSRPHARAARAAGAASRCPRPSKQDAAGGRLDQPHQHAPGASTCRSRTRRRARASRRAAIVKLTPSTACTVPALRANTSPPRSAESAWSSASTCTSGAVMSSRCQRPDAIADGADAGDGVRRRRSSISGGSAASHGGSRVRQRGSNRQPGGRCVTDRAPCPESRPADPARPSSDGMLASRPRCRDACGRSNTSATLPVSTMRRHTSPPPVDELRDHAQVVRDEDHRHAELVLQLAEQVEDLRLDGDVQRRRRLVGDQQRGLQASAMAIITRWRMPPESWCG